MSVVGGCHVAVPVITHNVFAYPTQLCVGGGPRGCAPSKYPFSATEFNFPWCVDNICCICKLFRFDGGQEDELSSAELKEASALLNPHISAVEGLPLTYVVGVLWQIPLASSHLISCRFSA